MLNFNSILLFSEHPEKLAEFYRAVFQKDPEWDEGGYSGWRAGSGHIVIGPHSEVKGKNANPQRIMINLETEKVKEEFERIKKLGAKVIAEPYNPMEEEKMIIATLSDPDGNYFQLASPME